MSKTATASNQVLDYHLRGTTPATLTPYLALLTNVESVTEVTGSGYARLAIGTGQFGNAAASGSIANTVVCVFPVATTNYSADVIGFAVYNASTAGTALRKSYLTSGSYRTFTGLNTGDVNTAPGHTFVNTDKVIVLTQAGTALPAGYTQGTIYFVVGVAGNTFQLALTSGGAAVAITADGGGKIMKIAPLTVLSGGTVAFGVGTLTFTEV